MDSPAIKAAYDPTIRAASDNEPGTISVYDVIGDDMSGGGFTEAKLAGILRNMSGRDIVLNINSPGGSAFQGLAIYNLLRDYEGKVTARVLGMAASAATFLMMAADDIQIGKAAAVMIHNTQSVAVGDRHDMQAANEFMERFDGMLVEVYADRTGGEPKAIGKMMDATTWFFGSQAVESGFADSLLSVDDVQHDDAGQVKNSARSVERVLRNKGLSRSEAKFIISQLKSTLRDAGSDDGAREAPGVSAVSEVLAIIRKDRIL